MSRSTDEGCVRDVDTASDLEKRLRLAGCSARAACSSTRSRSRPTNRRRRGHAGHRHRRRAAPAHARRAAGRHPQRRYERDELPDIDTELIDPKVGPRASASARATCCSVPRSASARRAGGRSASTATIQDHGAQQAARHPPLRRQAGIGRVDVRRAVVADLGVRPHRGDPAAHHRAVRARRRPLGPGRRAPVVRPPADARARRLAASAGRWPMR